MTQDQLTPAERIKDLVAKHLGIEPARLVPDASLADDLGADSLDKIELQFAIEDAFKIELDDDDVYAVDTFGKLVAVTESTLSASRPKAVAL